MQSKVGREESVSRVPAAAALDSPDVDERHISDG
jgi:hypothetical protein